MSKEPVREIIHRMRTPLSVIKGFVSNIKPNGEDEIEHQKVTLTSIDKLSKAIDDLAELIENDAQ